MDDGPAPFAGPRARVRAGPAGGGLSRAAPRPVGRAPGQGAPGREGVLAPAQIGSGERLALGEALPPVPGFQ